MNYCLEAFRLRDSFDAVIGGDDVLNVKPDPEGILLALERMGISASESMMVGDSAADMLAGKRAGVITAAALWHPQWSGDIGGVDPDYEFRTVRELSVFLLD